MTKRIVLCADDYGQAEAVSNGILGLLATNRLTAVSCLVNQPGWVDQAGRLLPYLDKVDVGLHLNFTEGAPISREFREQVGPEFPSLSRLLLQAMPGVPRLPHSAIYAEIKAQLAAFTRAMGRAPRFIDGHQHVHHLPGVREALLEVYVQQLKGSGVYMRAVTLPKMKSVKSVVINFTGGRGFAGLLDNHQIPHNTSFSGIYDFGDAANYRRHFLSFLAESKNGGLIMCHPGFAASDSISAARVKEYQYFSSETFLTDLANAKVALTRYTAAL